MVSISYAQWVERCEETPSLGNCYPFSLLSFLLPPRNTREVLVFIRIAFNGIHTGSMLLKGEAIPVTQPDLNMAGSWQGILSQWAAQSFLWISGATACGGRQNLLLPVCPSIPAVSPGAMETSSSPLPCESLPESVPSLIHPVIFVLEWFPDASPSWFGF